MIHAPGWRRDEMLVSLVCCIVALMSPVSWSAAVGQWVPGGLGPNGWMSTIELENCEVILMFDGKLHAKIVNI